MLKHGLYGTPVYRVWHNMLQRCDNPNNTAYDYYGGRGVSVCEEWRDAATFCRWALANGYQNGLTLDRIENDKGYLPSNCRWATRAVQSCNSRRLRSSNTSGYRGVYFHKQAGRWCASIGVDNHRIHLGRFDDPKEAAQAYDAFVTANRLSHTRNFS